jgi:hypothetical protein
VTILHDSHFHSRFGDPGAHGAMDIVLYQTLFDARRESRENAVYPNHAFASAP